MRGYGDKLFFGKAGETWECLHLWWGPWSSKPVGGLKKVLSGFDSHTLPLSETSTLLHQLFEGYEREGIAMPYTMADFRRDYVKEHLKDLTPEELLESLPLEGLLKALPPEERLKGLQADDIERYLLRLRARSSPGETPPPKE